MQTSDHRVDWHPESNSLSKKRGAFVHPNGILYYCISGITCDERSLATQKKKEKSWKEMPSYDVYNVQFREIETNWSKESAERERERER